MKRIKIFGAGSIGNHHAHAARRLGWEVTVCDTDPAALRRMEHELYPSRYGQWDPSIALTPNHEATRGGFDLLVIGTPPDSHAALALAALEEEPQAILIEKPLSDPTFARLAELAERSRRSPTRVFVGYDHVVGRAARAVTAIVESGSLGAITTIDVEFREHWAGIFQAHPWLTGPDASYLGYWQRGGGASGEHSHALNLWQYFAHVAGAGRIKQVDAMLDYVQEGRGSYDRLCLLNLRTESGMVGRTVQDVVTTPARKWARIQGADAAVEWVLGFEPGVDAVVLRRPGRAEEVQRIAKTRPDDFIEELQHIEQHCATGAPSPIDLQHGIDTMCVVAAAHESERRGARVKVDYAQLSPSGTPLEPRA